MPKRKTQRQLFTEAVLAESAEHDPRPVEKIMFEWWASANSGVGLRLTPKGDAAFRKAHIEFYQCSIPSITKSYHGFMSELSKKIKCPYFLGYERSEDGKIKPFIRLYDSKIAMMMTLYGDIHSYLESIQVRER